MNLDRLLQDVAFAVRSLRRRPLTGLLPAITLAVGIGSATAVFTVSHAVLLEPPGYEEPDRLGLIWHHTDAQGGERIPVSGPDAAAYVRADAVTALAFVTGAEDLLLGGSAGPTHVRIGVATPGLFATLGVDAARGRVFRAGEGVVGPAALERAEDLQPAPLVLTHEAWRGSFGADPELIGRDVTLSGRAMTVIGVLPAGFELDLPATPGPIHGWTPLPVRLDAFRRPERLRDQDSDNTGTTIVRIAPGVDFQRAGEEVARIAAGLRDEVASYREAGLRAGLVPLHEDRVREARPLLLALLGAVGLVLLIACINVANLLLARSADRVAEMSMRAALGAGRGRLVRQVLTEALVLAFTGAIPGLLLAAWGVDILLALAPPGLPGAEDVGLSGAALAFSLGATCGAALLFGSAPAHVLVREPADGVRDGFARGARRSARLGRGLVVGEVALSFALLVGAGLMLGTVASLQRVDPGFEARGLLTFRVSLPGGSIGGPAARAALYDGFERRIRALPGVTSVGLVGGLPFGADPWRQPYGPGGTDPAAWAGNRANFRVVSAEYHRAMGTRLLAGRLFTPRENVNEGQRVAIVDARLAGMLDPEGDAVGATIGFPLDGEPVEATVVGVVEDVRFHDLRRAGRETIYVPIRQEASRDVSFAVRTSGDPSALAPAIREIAGELASGGIVPVYDIRDMESYVEEALAPSRFALMLVSVFATVALILAAVGLVGILAYLVGRRTRELGIRLALGASPRALVRRVIAEGLTTASIGVGIGVFVALAGSFGLAGLLFGVGPADPATYAAVAALLLAVGGLASWIPARRVLSIEPAAALKHD